MTPRLRLESQHRWRCDLEIRIVLAVLTPGVAQLKTLGRDEAVSKGFVEGHAQFASVGSTLGYN